MNTIMNKNYKQVEFHVLSDQKSRIYNTKEREREKSTIRDITPPRAIARHTPLPPVLKERGREKIPHQKKKVSTRDD